MAVGKRHLYAEINIELNTEMNNKINALFFNSVECSVREHILMLLLLLLSFLLPGEFIAGFYCRICPTASSSCVSVASLSFEDLETESLHPLRHKEGAYPSVIIVASGHQLVTFAEVTRSDRDGIALGGTG